jgi:hypothetical protein
MRAAVDELRRGQLGILRTARARVDAIRGAGLSPAQDLARAEGDLAVTISEISAAELASAVAEDRLATTRQVVAEEAARPPEQRTFAAGPGETLRGQILNLRVQLAAQLARRKPDHPEVKGLEAQIKQLEAALGEPEKTEEGTPPIPPALSREVVTAQLAVDEARTRLAQLRQRADQLRRSLPALRKAADDFADTDFQMKQAEAQVQQMDMQLTTIDAEIARLRAQLQPAPAAATPANRQRARDIEILDEARILPSPKTWPRFFLFVVVAILGGAVLSSVVILGLHYTSVTFTNEAEARAMLHARVLGAIPRSDLPVQEAGPPLQGR